MLVTFLYIISFDPQKPEVSLDSSFSKFVMRKQSHRWNLPFRGSCKDQRRGVCESAL